MADIALTNTIRELISVLRAQVGTMGAQPWGTVGRSETFPHGGKGTNELLAENTDEMRALREQLGKSTKDSKESFVDHAKKIEHLGAILAAVGPLLNQTAKYFVTRPYELLGGQAGAVARPALERERDAGQVITSIASLLGTVLFGFGTGGAIAALGAAGGNKIIGRSFFQDESLRAGSLQSIAQMSQAGVPGFREAAMQQYGLMRLDVAGLGMGAGRLTGTSMAQQLTAIGMSAPESTQLIAQTIQAGGALGFRRLQEAGGAKAITQMVNEGIYGSDPVAIATSLSQGLRVGFSREMMESASRRTGLQLPEISQAATIARMQTFLGGRDVSHDLFTRITGTTMTRELSPMAVLQQMTHLAGGASSAAEGNEAAEMLLFQQFQRANPGASYMDFVEARRNKETDQRWLKTVAAGTTAMAAGGQQGKILGGALFGIKPQYVARAGEFMNEIIASGSIEEITRKEGAAGLAKGEQQFRAADFSQTMATATKFQAEYGETIKKTTERLEAATKQSGNFTEMLKNMNIVMDSLVKSAQGLWIEKRLTDNTVESYLNLR